MNESLYIVMPAYNEEANIKTTVQAWYKIIEKINTDSRLVIVNDGSKDDTFSILNSLQQEYPQLIALNKENSGHGATCLYAYNYAITEGATYIFQTDSDGQTNPDEFWPLWENRNNYNFIIGSRQYRKDGLSRIIVTKILKYLLFVIFGLKIEDCNSPFRLMNAQRLQPLLKYIPKDYFLSNIILSVLIVKSKETIKFLPISFKPRQGGTNSINIKKIIKIGINAIGDFYKIKQEIKYL